MAYYFRFKVGARRLETNNKKNPGMVDCKVCLQVQVCLLNEKHPDDMGPRFVIILFYVVFNVKSHGGAFSSFYRVLC